MTMRCRTIAQISPPEKELGKLHLLDGGKVFYTYTQKLESAWNIDSFLLSSCVDESHKRINNRYDSGGGLTITQARQIAEQQHVDRTVYWSDGTPRFRYVGLQIPAFMGYNKPLPECAEPLSTRLDLASLGPTAWNKFKPLKPEADLGVFLAELRDFPRLFKFRLRYFKDLGSSYLNVGFGWLPFLSDISKAIKTYQQLERRLQNVRNLNGKWVLRKGLVRREEELLDQWDIRTATWPFYPSQNSYFTADGAVHSALGNVKRIHKAWFSGRFRYYIPGLDLVLRTSPLNQVTRRLFGLQASPKLLWELMPWSWMIDWFSNIGDVISNMSDTDLDLVAKYAYVMGYTSDVAQQTSTGIWKDGQQLVGSISREQTVKGRVAANPFGFELSEADLSSGQWAILAALGLSKTKI